MNPLNPVTPDPLAELERLLRAIQDTRALRDGTTAALSEASTIAPSIAPEPSPPAVRGRRLWLWAAAPVLLALIFGLVRFSHGHGAASGDPPSGRSPAAAVPPPASPAAVQQPAAPPPASSPAVVPGVRVDVVASRQVWIRVSVDEQPVFKGQLRPGDRRRFESARVITVRVGDAGAARLLVDDVDVGVLGRDGQVINRTFASRKR